MQLSSLRFAFFFFFLWLLNVLSRSRRDEHFGRKQVRDKSSARCNAHTARCRATSRAPRSLTNSRKFFISTCPLRECLRSDSDTEYMQSAHVPRLPASPVKMSRRSAATAPKAGRQICARVAAQIAAVHLHPVGFSKWN